jgi:hypothetical protein
MNQGNNCGGSGHESERNRGEKSVAFRGNVWPSSSSSQKDYRSLLSESDREDRKPGNGSSEGGRSRRNVSYRRDAFDDDRELQTSGFIDCKGKSYHFKAACRKLSQLVFCRAIFSERTPRL